VTWLSIASVITWTAALLGIAVSSMLVASLRRHGAETDRQSWNRRMLTAGVLLVLGAIAFPLLVLGARTGALLVVGVVVLDLLTAVACVVKGPSRYLVMLPMLLLLVLGAAWGLSSPGLWAMSIFLPAAVLVAEIARAATRRGARRVSANSPTG
jgi:hypothetical protein